MKSQRGIGRVENNQMNSGSEIEFVGGPLDGPLAVSGKINGVLSVEGSPEGRYWYIEDYSGGCGNCFYLWVLVLSPEQEAKVRPPPFWSWIWSLIPVPKKR